MTTAISLPHSHRLTRTRNRKLFAGVCSGLAAFTGVNRWVFRAIFVGSILMSGGLTLLAYLTAAFVMPEDIEPVPVTDVPTRSLRRSRNDRLLTGVCAGIAGRLNMDPTVVRLLWVLASFGSLGLGFIVYFAMAALVPRADQSRRY